MTAVILTAPRAGGTWLARLLGFRLPCELLRVSCRRQLRQLGYPHGRPDAIRAHAARHGIKVHWDMVGRYKWLPSLEHVIPDGARLIFLTRDDREAQARSLLTAEETDKWFTPRRPYLPQTDEAVADAMSLLGWMEDGWRGWLQGRDHTHVTYEQLVANGGHL